MNDVDTTTGPAAPDDPFDLGGDAAPAAPVPASVIDSVSAPAIGNPAPPPLSEDAPEPPAVSDADRPAPRRDERLTPAQRQTFDELLAVGADRPLSAAGLVDELRDRLSSGTAGAMTRWGQSLWFSKSQLTESARCEGMIAANAAEERTGGPERPLHPATMAGIVAHRAIQICQTHPGEQPAHYILEAIRASRNEAKFGDTWSGFGDAERSDLQMTATSRLLAFSDSWPPLRDEWSWRFEESTQARIGKLTLGARVDLILGRPRADGRQTMLLCDLKTGSLGENHELEASFYALVSALRWGVPPWRSMVYSLASGEWTDPDITAERLRATTDAVIAAVNARVEILCEERDAVLTAGEWCRFCPAAPTCPAHLAYREDPPR